MATSFQITALPVEKFESLFAQSDEALSALGVRRVVAESKPNYPCRVSLVDAEIGEEVLIIPFVHHDVLSPYRASGPIFVRMNARTASPEADEIPSLLRSRQLSVRGYDALAMMVSADVVNGNDLGLLIAKRFENGNIKYLHIHNASPGCYNCRVEWVG
ncbi:MAG: DUF1203 domain-containing protein [Rhizobacter sp.]|nr:DUF1203 domain-containing protein [Chlorobiales bacterium]